MAAAPQTFIVDDQGVWSVAPPGVRTGIKWSEVYRASACLCDLKSGRVGICVTLDFEWGEFVEVWDSKAGFKALVEAIKLRLPGVKRSWIDELTNLDPAAPPRILYQRRPPVE
jgi:hypothetical protein